MVTKEFIRSQMIRLEANYGQERFNITQSMFDLWVDMFKTLEPEGLKASVDEYIRTNDYPPTVSGILKIYNQKIQYRKEFYSFLLGKYNLMVRWYEEESNPETFKKLLEYVWEFPREERTEKVQSITYGAIEAYTGSDGMIKLNQYLESIWTQKDNL